MIALTITAIILAMLLTTRIELQRRKYRDLWFAEAKRHAGARMELSQWIETSRVSGDACAHHKSTIAKLKMEVTRLHEQNDELREIVRVERSHPPETFPAFVGIKVEPTE